MEAKSTSSVVGIVVKIIDPYTIAINRGSEHGIRIGMRYLVYNEGEELFDPETHESLGRLELICGVGVIAHVQPKLATLQSDKKIIKHKRTISRPVESRFNLFAVPKEIDEPTEELAKFCDLEEGVSKVRIIE